MLSETDIRRNQSWFIFNSKFFLTYGEGGGIHPQTDIVNFGVFFALQTCFLLLDYCQAQLQLAPALTSTWELS